MKLFKKRNLEFRIVHIGDKAFDYPRDMPIPRIGEFISFEEDNCSYSGRVVDVQIAVYNGLHSIDVYVKKS